MYLSSIYLTLVLLLKCIFFIYLWRFLSLSLRSNKSSFINYWISKLSSWEHVVWGLSKYPPVFLEIFDLNLSTVLLCLQEGIGAVILESFDIVDLITGAVIFEYLDYLKLGFIGGSFYSDCFLDF